MADEANLSNEVHQATGIIAERANCDVDEAFDKLKVRAAKLGQTLDETALDVIGHVIDFGP